MMKSCYLLVLFLLAFIVHRPLTAQQSTRALKPDIQHGVTYKKVANINQYYVSEKLDGVRGYWDGKQLLTRQGNLINSPSWFTRGWPTLPIDGELWLDKGKFQILQSCVSKHNPEENKIISCWINIRFMMFDLPKNKGNFSERVDKMQRLLKQVSSPYLAMISQVKLKEISELDNKLNEVIARQGEGLMLHLASAYYKTGRNTALMKLKKHQDAEAIVIGHTKGKGKYQDLLGAIEVETVDGIVFKIGSGFSDVQRTNPPKVGTIITFKYNGLTDAGIPRFARFWRIKATD
jgi:DNA ligase-1